MLLDDKMTELADAIRSKTGKTSKLSIPQMVSSLTPSENVYWEGNLSEDYETHLLTKPIPAHTKISDIIVTSDKPTDPTKTAILLEFKDRGKVSLAYITYVNGRWEFNVIANGESEDKNELPDDLIGLEGTSAVNNLKIVVKGADSGISELPTYTTVFQAYTGLANAIKKSTNASGKLTIEKMITLLGGTTSKDDTPPTEEVLLWENNNFNYHPFTMYTFNLNGDSRFLHPYKLKFKFHTVSSSSGNGSLYLYTNPSLNNPGKRFTISDGNQDHEIVFDIPQGTLSVTYMDSYMIYTFQDLTITTMAIYAIFPKEN